MPFEAQAAVVSFREGEQGNGAIPDNPLVNDGECGRAINADGDRTTDCAKGSNLFFKLANVILFRRIANDDCYRNAA